MADLSTDADKDKQNFEATLCYETLKDGKILTMWKMSVINIWINVDDAQNCLFNHFKLKKGE